MSGKIALSGVDKAGGCSAVSYAWFMWQKGFKGNAICRITEKVGKISSRLTQFVGQTKNGILNRHS